MILSDTPDRDQRHRDRMRRKKDAIDAAIAQADREQGLLLVLTGNGKGKSSSAFGMVARALGHGLQVGVAQFIKGCQDTGEEAFFRRQPGVTWRVLGEGFTWDTQDRARDAATARRGWVSGAGDAARSQIWPWWCWMSSPIPSSMAGWIWMRCWPTWRCGRQRPACGDHRACRPRSPVRRRGHCHETWPISQARLSRRGQGLRGGLTCEGAPLPCPLHRRPGLRPGQDHGHGGPGPPPSGPGPAGAGLQDGPGFSRSPDPGKGLRRAGLPARSVDGGRGPLPPAPVSSGGRGRHYSRSRGSWGSSMAIAFQRRPGDLSWAYRSWRSLTVQPHGPDLRRPGAWAWPSYRPGLPFAGAFANRVAGERHYQLLAEIPASRA
jgi:hypothetical protein